MPVRAFIVLDPTSLNWHACATKVLMPVRAFIVLDRRKNWQSSNSYLRLNAREGIYCFGFKTFKGTGNWQRMSISLNAREGIYCFGLDMFRGNDERMHIES